MTRKMKTMDGNAAAAHVAYAFTDVAAIYPITPSSPMADYTDTFAAAGRKNLFGREVLLSEMQSEGGAAGALHGALQGGALAATYTASQGLLLMIPSMYKIAGELLPAVIHVSARAIATHALSIFGDHSDIYACRSTGFAMLCSSNVQEVMDIAAVAHLAAIEGRVPFLHFFDGFRTSHEIQKIAVWDYETLRELCDMDAVAAFRARALHPEHPVQRGTAQNPDTFFQAREACNPYYDALPDVVTDCMNRINIKLGTDYRLFNYVGAPDAAHVIIAMGSVCDTIEETMEHLNLQGGRYGLVRVHLYRPFSARHLLSVLPKTVKQITVLDRTKEPGAPGEPLYLDVAAALKDSAFSSVLIVSGRYGLGSKDTTPADICAAYRNQVKPRFTLSITDDVTHLSLAPVDCGDPTPFGTTCCKFWGLGSDGTVGACKNSIKIIGDHTDLYVQAYFSYDSKKSGGVTVSHLRFGSKPIRSSYLVHQADFVACHLPSYIRRYQIVEDLKDGGTFLLNCPYTPYELEKELPGQVKRYLHDHHIHFYTIDGFRIASELGLGGRINTILQAAFFCVSELLPVENAITYMKEAASAAYGKKGSDVVKMNHSAIERGFTEVHAILIPESWGAAEPEPLSDDSFDGSGSVPEYVQTIQRKVNAMQGDSLPVSAFSKHPDGTVPLGTSAFEKRGIGLFVPVWNAADCLQCSQCSLVCPHACIRPAVLTDAETNAAPKGLSTQLLRGLKGETLRFAITVSTLDCTGCGVCVSICPGNKKGEALALASASDVRESQQVFDYCSKLPKKPAVSARFPLHSIKGSQFQKPLLEFSGACAGCGETPYAKLVTQLFGDRMRIANATGCSSIWGGSSPSTPYTVDEDGRGPAWANSLFEDNAEYGYGMYLAATALRRKLIDAVHILRETTRDAQLRDLCRDYLVTKDSSSDNAPAARSLIAELKTGAHTEPEVSVLLENKEHLAKISQWIFGGDGWAYDIGYGGLDHVLASTADVNVLVFDTEVYSNTGGQASKSTPLGAVAGFSSSGKSVKKKDIAALAMNYGYVYVAQVAMGADASQCLRAFLEAESYPGPSLVIAYSPCINHGIRGGMRGSMEEEKKAVASGYWHLFRYDPRLSEAGRNPFQLDSGEPVLDYIGFLENEVRYNRLSRTNKERAAKLFSQAAKDAKEKYARLKALAAPGSIN